CGNDRDPNLRSATPTCHRLPMHVPAPARTSSRDRCAKNRSAMVRYGPDIPYLSSRAKHSEVEESLAIFEKIIRDVSTSLDMTKKRLLLFDIDDTLVNTAGAGVESLKRTLHNRFGAKDDLHDIEIAGKTDRAIIRDILRKYQVDPNEENIASFAQEYIHGLPLSLSRSRGRVLRGIQLLLERLKTRPHIVLALLTGNLQQGARLKLQHYGLWDFFEFGAFADDH